VETVAGLLLGVQIHPLVDKIPLEQLPADKIGGQVVFVLGEF